MGQDQNLLKFTCVNANCRRVNVVTYRRPDSINECNCVACGEVMARYVSIRETRQDKVAKSQLAIYK